MRHDRTGELLDDEDQADERAPVHDPRCRDGWIEYRNADHPRPCLRCRPNLTRRPTSRPPDPEVARAGIAAVRAALSAAKGSRR